MENVTILIALMIMFPAYFGTEHQIGYNIIVCLILLFTILFANFAEALAEGRGKAHADSLIKKRNMLTAKRVCKDGSFQAVGTICNYVMLRGGILPADLQEKSDAIARLGGTPLAVSLNNQIVGLIYLKDTIKPEDKISIVRSEQMQGKLVAMTGDGLNDAPALAQADVGIAMNSGTAAAKEAANMVDLDSDPTKYWMLSRSASSC